MSMLWMLSTSGKKVLSSRSFPSSSAANESRNREIIFQNHLGLVCPLGKIPPPRNGSNAAHSSAARAEPTEQFTCLYKGAEALNSNHSTASSGIRDAAVTFNTYLNPLAIIVALSGWFEVWKFGSVEQKIGQTLMYSHNEIDEKIRQSEDRVKTAVQESEERIIAAIQDQKDP